MDNNYKLNLIKRIDGILNSQQSGINHKERLLLIEVKDALEKADNKTDIIKALGLLANLLQVTIKAAMEMFSD